MDKGVLDWLTSNGLPFKDSGNQWPSQFYFPHEYLTVKFLKKRARAFGISAAHIEDSDALSESPGGVNQAMINLIIEHAIEPKNRTKEAAVALKKQAVKDQNTKGWKGSEEEYPSHWYELLAASQ